MLKFMKSAFCIGVPLVILSVMGVVRVDMRPALTYASLAVQSISEEVRVDRVESLKERAAEADLPSEEAAELTAMARSVPPHYPSKRALFSLGLALLLTGIVSTGSCVVRWASDFDGGGDAKAMSVHATRFRVCVIITGIGIWLMAMFG